MTVFGARRSRLPRWLFVAATVSFVVLSLNAVQPGKSADPGLVAAYAFDEGTGLTTADSSGNGLTGTINGATWTSAGKYGNALSFDGASSYVDLGNPTALKLTGSMTWSAWVFATGSPVDDGQIVAKSTDGAGTGGWQVKTSPDTGPHTFGVAVSTDGTANAQRYSTTVRQVNTWYFVTGVYDAANRKLDIYVNGQLDNGVLRGTIPAGQFDANTNVNIGRRSGGFYFQGTIDEVRIYNRALSSAEIQSVMLTPITQQGAPDTTPPTAPGTPLAAPMSATRIDTSWDPATDDVGVTSYRVERCQGSGCTNFAQIAAPPSTSYTDTTVTASTTYRYRIRAADAAGNLGPYSPISTATTVSGASAFSNDVVVQNLNFVPAMLFMPGGKMLMAEIGGTLRVVQPGATQPDSAPFLTIPSAVATADAGTHDLVLDPNFATNHYLYVFYEHGTTSNYRDTVSRFTVAADLNTASAASELVLWQDNNPTTTGSHHGASLAFGPDGKLYISTGDNGQPQDSQSLSSYHGKILRINPDGTIPSDNPFVDGNGSNKDEIWAYGMRNPYRMTFQPGTGRLYVGDVGGNTPATSVEEIDRIVKGGNYGWPLCDGGPCGAAGTTSPVYWYPHSGRDAAIMGGFFYTGAQYPAAFQGSYFFADYAQNWLKRITFDPTGTIVTGVFNFLPLNGALDSSAIGDPVQLRQGPDGALYYLDLSFDEQAGSFNAGTLRRISFLGSANQAPQVSASATPLQGLPPLQVAFSSAGTVDAEGDPLTYAWDFGDGGTSTSPNPSHTYQTGGQFQATLTVSDGQQTAFKSVLIRVGNAPVPTILTPSNGTKFRAGDHIAISGNATDAEDGTLPDSAFSWTVIFHHDTHVHPGVGPINGVRNFTFDIPTSGHDFEGNTSYEIVLRVTDSSGLQQSTSVFVNPDKVNVSIDTMPSGLNVELDGITRATPFVYDGLKGFHDTLNAPAQSSGGTAYDFTSWSDGGAQSHEIVVPDIDSSLVATYHQAGGPDTQPPTAPGSLTATAVGTSQINLSWQASTDNVGVTGYQVERCQGANCTTFTQIATPTGTTFNDTGLTAGTSYSYRVRAVDAAANLSAYSTVATATTTTPDIQPPTAPATLSATAISGSQINLNWSGATDNVGVTGYQVERCQGSGCTFAPIASPSGTTYNDTGLTPGTSYSYRVRATDAAGNLGPYSPIASAVTTAPDTQPPTAPATVVATAVGASQINISWSAATDNVGVTGYRLERCQGTLCTTFASLASPSGTSYSDMGLAPGTSYSYRVFAVDAAGNNGPYSPVATTTTQIGPSGLVAAYGFNEGSGTTTADASGNSLTGTLNGAAWTTLGKFGNALSFNGSSNYVDLGNPTPLKLTGSMTWSAWIYATSNPADDGQIVAKSGGTNGTLGSQFKTSPDTGPHTFGVAVSGDGNTNAQRYSTTVRQVNTWYFVTGVYDAANRKLDIYVNGQLDNGVLRGTIPASQFDPATNVNIGRRSGGFYFAGRIDEVRIYNRALSAPEIQADMNSAVTNTPDTQAPTAPTSLTATAAASTQVNLSWAAATDNVGVTGYRVERCQGASCTAFAQVATPTATTYSDTGLTAGTSYSYRVRAVDAAGNAGGYSPVASATTTAPDTDPPTAPATLTATATSSAQIGLTWAAASDNVGVTGYRLERCQGTLCTAFAQIATPSGTTYSDTGLTPNTSYSYRVRAVDAAANAGAYSPIASATTPFAPSGLVAAYGFNEGTGTTTADTSGNAITGSLTGTTWTTAGKFGNALVFNGTTSFVNLGNPTPLKITGSMTWSAWVYATANPADDGQIVAKSSGGGGTLGWQFKTSPDTSPHTFGVGVSGDGVSNVQRYSTTVRQLNTWYFVAGVYDAASRKLDIYVNGQLDNGVLRGTIPASQFDPNTNVNIGRRSGGFYFAGRIDELRIYNRALGAAEIQALMNTPV